jgi:hypothetical protein
VLGRQLVKLAPNLRRAGIVVSFARTETERRVSLRYTPVRKKGNAVIAVSGVIPLENKANPHDSNLTAKPGAVRHGGGRRGAADGSEKCRQDAVRPKPRKNKRNDRPDGDDGKRGLPNAASSSDGSDLAPGEVAL